MSTLSEEHRALLRESSGLSDFVIDARGYHSIAPDALVEMAMEGKYDKSALKAGGAIGIPVYRPDRQIHCVQLRLDKAVGDRRYLWPNDLRNAVDVYPGHLEYIDDPDVPLLITEGTKKVDAIVSHIPEGEKFCVIGLNGCWGWRSRSPGTMGKSSVASPDFQDIALDNRLIIYIPDSDYHTNINVKRGWDGCGTYLASKTKQNRLHVCVVPPKGLKKQGADDYLLEHSLEELLSNSKSVGVEFETAEPDLSWDLMGDVLAEEDNVTWLVKDLIPSGGICLLVGHSRSYKTWHAMRLCLDLIRAANVWDHPQLEVEESVNVLYINMEMVKAMIRARMRTLIVAPQYAGTDFVAEMSAKFALLDNKIFDMRNPDHVTWLIENIRENNTKLAVIDTFSMVWQGNENDSAEVGQFYKTLRMISELTGVTWLVLHHLKKPSKETNGQDAIFGIRGSGQIVQQADAILGLEVLDEDDAYVRIKVTHHKSRSSTELKTWTNIFDRGEGIDHRDVHFEDVYAGSDKPAPKAVQDEVNFAEFLLSQEDCFVEGMKIADIVSMATVSPLTKDMGQNKVSKLLRAKASIHVLEYNKKTQVYTRGEQFDAIRAVS